MNFSSSSFKYSLCLLLLVLSISNAKLVVKAPESLKKSFNDINGIDYTVLTPQNKITYKRAFIGSVTLADIPTACDPLPSLSGLDKDVVYNPVLLTTWGDCHYAQKVKNAEMAGAKMVILVLRHDMDANHATVRQLPISTNVEVLSISQSDGDVLVKYIQEEKDKNNGVAPTVEITYSYDVEKHLNFQGGSDVIVDFWFSSADTSKASYQFLDTLKDILADFGDKVKFYPHYVLWQYDDSSSTPDPRCVSNGLYCDPEPMRGEKLSGATAVMEDLRQIIFREQSAQQLKLDDVWWKYVLAFGENCVDKDLSKIEGCRDEIYETLPPSATRTIESDINNSFPAGAGKGENSYLKSEVNDREEMSVDHYPAFYVNKERYTSSFRNKYLIREFICSHFTQDKLPATCIESITATQTVTATSSDTVVYVLIVVVSVLVMAIMLYCVRRTVKRQVMVRMNDEISHIVTQYKQFKDKSNSFSADEDM